jgi:hypothetical protein
MKIMGQIKSRPTILSMIVTSFIMTSIVVMPIQSIAVAGEFSSHTVVPRESFSGVKMQQGGPQLDNDKKLDFGTSLKSVGQPGRDMQQRKILRSNDSIDTQSRKNCGTNCPR